MLKFKNAFVSYYNTYTVSDETPCFTILQGEKELRAVTSLKTRVEIVNLHSPQEPGSVTSLVNMTVAGKNKEIEIDVKDVVLYRTENDFKTMKRMSPIHLNIEYVVHNGLKAKYLSQDGGIYCFDLFTSSKNLNIEPIVKSLSIEIDTNGSVSYGNIFINSYEVKRDELFGSLKDLHDLIPYKVVLADGSTVVRQPRLAKLFLTDEQKELVEELRSLMAKMEEKKISVFFDTSCYELRCFNAATIEDMGYDCIPNYIEDESNDPRVVLSHDFHKFCEALPLTDLGEECVIVMKKDALDECK